jgi:apolipoprotein N-acyltransferase
MEPPDIQEKGIRFGCGFVFGFVLAGASWIAFSIANGYYYFAFAAIVGVLFGLGAMHYGDAFWERLSRLSRYWWWW